AGPGRRTAPGPAGRLLMIRASRDDGAAAGGAAGPSEVARTSAARRRVFPALSAGRAAVESLMVRGVRGVAEADAVAGAVREEPASWAGRGRCRGPGRRSGRGCVLAWHVRWRGRATSRTFMRAAWALGKRPARVEPRRPGRRRYRPTPSGGNPAPGEIGRAS